MIYGEGKTPAQVAEIFRRLADNNPNVLCTRASAAAAEAVLAAVPGAEYHELCRIVELRRDQTPPVGRVALAAPNLLRATLGRVSEAEKPRQAVQGG